MKTGMSIEKLVYICIIAVVLTFAAQAVQTAPVDPNKTPTFTLTCQYPIEREDGKPLAIEEIAQINFFVSTGTVGNWTPAGTNTNACRQVYDLSGVADGDYFYTATATDNDGRESVYAPEVVALTVKRIQAPKAPTGLQGLAS